MSGSSGYSAVGLCVNHPAVAAQTACASCGQPFCSSCLVTFQGQPHCGPCRDARLAQMHGPPAIPQATGPLTGTGVADLGGWLSSGWDLLKDDLLIFVLATLIMLLLVSALSILQGPLMCGMYMMVWHKMLYGEAKLEKLFDGFKRSLWSILASLGLAIPGIVIGMVACLPLVLVPVLGAFGGGEAAVGGLIIVIALIVLIAAAGGVVLSGVIFFMFAHIAARNANPLEALSASWEVVRRNFVMFCWVGLVYGLISSAGSLVCGVGLLVTYPLIIAAHAKAYADHFGIEGFDRV